MAVKLGEAEWVRAGLRALARHGVEAVRVEALAQDLKVTKGSFYWHFKDRNALLAALLEAWCQRATGAIIDEVEAKGGDARDRLHNLCGITYRADARLERAVRDWAAKDSNASASLAQIDDRRLAYLRRLFTELGFVPGEAKARARFAYDACLGQILIGTPPASRRATEDYIRRIVAILTARD